MCWVPNSMHVLNPHDATAIACDLSILYYNDRRGRNIYKIIGRREHE